LEDVVFSVFVAGLHFR